MRNFLILLMLLTSLLLGCSQTNTQVDYSAGVAIKPTTGQEVGGEDLGKLQEEYFETDEQPIVNLNNNSSDTVALSEMDAKTIAFNHAGILEDDVDYLRVELDYEQGVTVYEVDFYANRIEYDYNINAQNGEILSFEIDNKNQMITQNADNTYITDETAKMIAIEHANVLVTEVTSLRVEFDFDDGIAVYDIEFRVGMKEYEYEINALTSDILKFEIE